MNRIEHAFISKETDNGSRGDHRNRRSHPGVWVGPGLYQIHKKWKIKGGSKGSSFSVIDARGRFFLSLCIEFLFDPS